MRWGRGLSQAYYGSAQVPGRLTFFGEYDRDGYGGRTGRRQGDGPGASPAPQAIPRPVLVSAAEPAYAGASRYGGEPRTANSTTRPSSIRVAGWGSQPPVG